MSIADFYQKFVSATENNALVESLRRLSLLDDPKAMFEGGTMGEWGYWTPDPDGAEA
ncbi:MAG TPA: hypothetical protein VNW71_16250 [Thermoanaerobaculia bacterium]|nr:hypothetical protein [Thermoanaerobaculia bacterium]